jgi:hypothetical protein
MNSNLEKKLNNSTCFTYITSSLGTFVLEGPKEVIPKVKHPSAYRYPVKNQGFIAKFGYSTKLC